MDYVFDLQDKGEVKESRKAAGEFMSKESWNQGKINEKARVYAA